MITTQQIKDICKYLNTPQAIETLLQGYEHELHIKELKSGKKIEITVLNAKGENPQKIAATPILKGIFAFHKAAFDCKGTSITHVASGFLMATGKNKCVENAVKYLEDNQQSILPDLENIRSSKEMGMFKQLKDETMVVMREAANKARYGL